MDHANAHRLLQTMIDYFEAGNKESDRSAKKIIAWDFENETVWKEKIKELQESGKWSGIRAPEADIISGALRFVQQRFQQHPV